MVLERVDSLCIAKMEMVIKTVQADLSMIYKFNVAKNSEELTKCKNDYVLNIHDGSLAMHRFAMINFIDISGIGNLTFHVQKDISMMGDFPAITVQLFSTCKGIYP